jgi:chromate transporter
MPNSTESAVNVASPPTHGELFITFLLITLSSFGAPLPWTRRMLVEKKRWMTAEQFNEVFALCQFLPGPNIVNLAAVVGSRMHGASGAIAAWMGFLALPFFLMLAVGMLYLQFGDIGMVRAALGGIAAAAAGLIVATFGKMAVPLFRTLDPAPVLVLLTVGAIGVMRLPLLWVLAAAPVSITLIWWWRR